MKTRLKLGCDPEVFLRKNGRKTFTSAVGFSTGTKASPQKLKKGGLQVDGMALEFNIKPATTKDAWVGNIKSVMDEMKEWTGSYDVVATPTAHFTKKHLEAQPECATELGCNPDFNAWRDSRANPTPNATNVNFRTGAGHIHFGWCEGVDPHHPVHLATCELLVKSLDVTLGFLCTKFDKDVLRSSLYGKPGAYRPKPYGCEYRVPSNAWLRDEATIAWVYDVCKIVFKLLCRGYILSDRFNESEVYYVFSNRNIYSNSHRKMDFIVRRYNIPQPPL